MLLWSVFTTSLEPTLSKIPNERKPRHRLAPLGGASMRTRFCQNYFLGEKDLAKPRLNFPRGGGVWGGIRTGI